jgi:hypothetical protein
LPSDALATELGAIESFVQATWQPSSSTITRDSPGVVVLPRIVESGPP